MHSDHRQPGCSVIRAAFTEPRSTTSTSVLSGVRRSSGEPKLFFTTPAMMFPQVDVTHSVQLVRKGRLAAQNASFWMPAPAASRDDRNAVERTHDSAALTAASAWSRVVGKYGTATSSAPTSS